MFGKCFIPIVFTKIKQLFKTVAAHSLQNFHSQIYSRVFKDPLSGLRQLLTTERL